VQGLIGVFNEYDRVVSAYVPIAIAVFTLSVVLPLFAVRIRRRRARGFRRATRWHETNPFEGTYAMLLACVAALLLYLTFTTQRKVDTVSNQRHPSVVIKVARSTRGVH
jgi:heme/copper-type cytochrome/quinol oxidase subunit 2